MTTETLCYVLVFIFVSGITLFAGSVIIKLVPETTEGLDRALYSLFYRFHPQVPYVKNYLKRFSRYLENSDLKFSPQSFLLLKEIGVVVSYFLGAFALGSIGGILLAVVVFIYPDVKLRGDFEKKKEEIRRDFPEFIDLLALIVESGIDFGSAVERISKYFVVGTLKNELERIVTLLKKGMRRRDVLKRWAEVWEIEVIDTFYSIVVQAEESGTALGKVLKDLAERIREDRFAAVEKKASQLPVKLMLPLFLIFGSILMIIFGMIVAQMMGVL